MFTGLVEAVGQVVEVKPTTVGFRVRLKTELARGLQPGESIAVNGVCLTVVSADGDEMHADVSPETARVTALGTLKRGSLVNLERPLRADDRFGGHFVQGHIDATGTIEEIRHQSEFFWVTVKFPGMLAPYLVRRGSIAVDGISLTIAGLSDRHFDVQIIPHTWENTNLRAARDNDLVNIECDIVGKYVVRMAELAGLAPGFKPSSTH